VLYVDTKYGWGFNDKQQKWIRQIAEVLRELIVHEQKTARKKDSSRITDFWQKLDAAAFQGHTLEEFSRAVICDCAGLIESEYGFIALREPGEDSFRTLAATPNVPRSLVTQHFLVKQGLIGWAFGNGKPLFISRMNPDTPDHYLFASSESLPHHGSLWCIPARLSLGHSVAFAFLSRNPMDWGSTFQSAISHALHFFQLTLEQLFYQDQVRGMKTFDLTTGLLNPFTFESRLDALASTSMQNSTPFTLALLQVEPWQALHSKVTPGQIRQWQIDLAAALCEASPPNALLGQLAENRFGIIFPETVAGEARHPLSRINEAAAQACSKIRAAKLQPYLAAAGFPHDSTRTDELWTLVSRRLLSTFRGGGEAPEPNKTIDRRGRSL
jgi:GGDEF domain-containing protein